MKITIFSLLKIHIMNKLCFFRCRWSLRETILCSEFLRSIVFYISRDLKYHTFRPSKNYLLLRSFRNQRINRHCPTVNIISNDILFGYWIPSNHCKIGFQDQIPLRKGKEIKRNLHRTPPSPSGQPSNLIIDKVQKVNSA